MALSDEDYVLTWADEPTLVVAALFVAFVAFIGWRRGLLFQTDPENIYFPIEHSSFFSWPYNTVCVFDLVHWLDLPPACSAVCIAQLCGTISAGAKNFGAPADAHFCRDGVLCWHCRSVDLVEQASPNPSFWTVLRFTIFPYSLPPREGRRRSYAVSDVSP